MEEILEFLEVAIHSILYVRQVYIPEIFEKRRKYGIPVPFSRSIQLNNYINEILLSLKDWLLKDWIDKICIIIWEKDSIPLERFIFHIKFFQTLNSVDNFSELENVFRTFLLKINISDSLLIPNSKYFSNTFSIAAEVKNPNELSRQKEIGSSLKWIPWFNSTSNLIHKPRIIPLKDYSCFNLSINLFIEENSYKQKLIEELEKSKIQRQNLNKNMDIEEEEEEEGENSAS